MTQFDPSGGTFHSCLSPCTTIVDADDARQYLEAYSKYLAERNKTTVTDAMVIAKKNIGYYAGYQTEEVFNRMLRLFKTVHPVFKRKYPKSARDAMILGMIYASKNIRQ